MKNKRVKDKIVDTIEKLDDNGVLNKRMVNKYKNNNSLNNEMEWRLLSTSCLF